MRRTQMKGRAEDRGKTSSPRCVHLICLPIRTPQALFPTPPPGGVEDGSGPLCNSLIQSPLCWKDQEVCFACSSVHPRFFTLRVGVEDGSDPLSNCAGEVRRDNLVWGFGVTLFFVCSRHIVISLRLDLKVQIMRFVAPANTACVFGIALHASCLFCVLFLVQPAVRSGWMPVSYSCSTSLLLVFLWPPYWR